MPELNVSDWDAEQVAEEEASLRARGAEPVLTITLRWRSAAERAQRDQDQADEAYLSTLRSQSVRGANRIRYQR